MKVSDITNAGVVSTRAMVLQQKTGKPVQFEITEQARDVISDWKASAKLSALITFSHQASNILESRVTQIGLDSSTYGAHSLRRTKPTLIYKRTKNLRAIQLLLGHTKLESTVKYLGIEVDDALEIAEQNAH